MMMTLMMFFDENITLCKLIILFTLFSVTCFVNSYLFFHYFPELFGNNDVMIS